jgi:hypothetical protein
MLKLEKVSKTLEVSISLRQRDRIFNRSLLQALLIALLIHGAALLLFPIAVAKISHSQLELPPVRVAADLSEGKVSTQLEQEELPPAYFLIPKSLTDSPPPLPSTKIATLQRASPLDLMIFDSWDEERRHPLHELLDPKPHFNSPVTVTLSGPLSFRRLHGTHPSLPSPLPEGLYRVVFHVEMENSTGQIFWYENSVAASDKQINKLAEQMVQEMRFEPIQNGFVTEGEVEFIFRQLS